MPILQDLQNTLSRSKQIFSGLSQSFIKSAVKFDSNPVVSTINKAEKVWKGAVDPFSSKSIPGRLFGSISGGFGGAISAPELNNPKASLPQLARSLVKNTARGVISGIKGETDQQLMSAVPRKLGLKEGTPLAFAAGLTAEILAPGPGELAALNKARKGKEILKFLTDSDVDKLAFKYGDDIVKKLSKGRVPQSVIDDISKMTSKAGKLAEDTKGALDLPGANAYNKASAEELNKSLPKTVEPTLEQAKAGVVHNPKPAAVLAKEQYEQSSKESLSTLNQSLLETPKKMEADKYAGNINLNRLDISPEAKSRVISLVDEIKPELEKVRGGPITHDEVLNAARESEALSKVVSRASTLKAEAAITALRQEVAQQASGGVVTEDFIKNLKILQTIAADTGSKLNAFKIQAGADGEVMEPLIKRLLALGHKAEDIVKASKGMDFKDARQVTKFYRSFVKPTFGEWLTEFRYNNMLSNPKTHLRNTLSNLTQTFVTRPLTIAASGDLKGALQYEKGAIGGISDGFKAFKEALSGKKGISKLDIDMIPTGKMPKFLTIPTKALEASDQFFSKIIISGEMSRGASEKAAQEMAKYSLFRQSTHPAGQGGVLRAIDKAIDGASAFAESVPLGRWFVPFIRTPMNFAKQWVEYSPLGFTTMIGAKAPKEQLAKAMIGSAITATAAHLAFDDKTTWAAPSDPKQKELFYASGRKPYSVLIGDKWVPMNAAGVFGLAVGIPAAIKYYSTESNTALTDSQLEKISNITKSLAGFYSQQTFMNGLSSFSNWASGEDSASGGKLAFTAGQVVPMSGLIRYINQIIDPVYKKTPKDFVGAFIGQLPGGTLGFEAYRSPDGEIQKRLPINAVLPYDVGQNNPKYEPYLESRKLKLQGNAVKREMEKSAIKSPTGSTPIVRKRPVIADLK